MGFNIQYKRVEKAMEFLRANFARNPSLAELANFVGVREHIVERTFQQWTGISPKQYTYFLTTKQALPALLKRNFLLDESLASGLSRKSHSNQLIVKTSVYTSASFLAKAADSAMRYGFTDSPFGVILLSWTESGVCWLAFVNSKEKALTELKSHWNDTKLREDSPGAQEFSNSIFGETGAEIPVVLRGTNLQIKVWEALVTTMPHEMLTYSDLALKVGLVKAPRVVATAVGKNKIAYLIPCHRITGTEGDIGAYRWGKRHKQQLFLWDKA